MTYNNQIEDELGFYLVKSSEKKPKEEDFNDDIDDDDEDQNPMATKLRKMRMELRN